MNYDDDSQQPPFRIEFQKMVFIHNALNDGWSVKKFKDKFIFSKNKGNFDMKQVLKKDFLVDFINDNLDLNRFCEY